MVTNLVTSRQPFVTNPVHDGVIQFGYNDRMQNRIREIRENRGLTQEQLADMIGTTKTQVSRLENSKRRLNQDWLQRLAHALGCKPAELIEEAQPQLAPDEQALLELYRGLSEADQRAVFRHADALPKPATGFDRKEGNGG